MTRKRLTLPAILWTVGALAALGFAVAGGEYDTFDILRQRRQQRRLQREIDSLMRVVDSLEAHKRRVLTDPKTQERIAREEFGMIRGKELLYRIAEPADPPSPRSP